MSDIQVFLSVGRTFTEEQEDFVVQLEEFLANNGLVSKTVGRNYFSNQFPLKTIKDLMHESAGTIVLALERVYIAEGFNKRNSDFEQSLHKQKVATVWNQIEASMAYMIGHPLLVLTEHDLRGEGLLEKGNEWYINQFVLGKPLYRDKAFLGVFNDWKESVEAFFEEKKSVSESEQLLPVKGISPKLKKAAIEAIIECGAFGSVQDIQTLFIDQRIAAWKNKLSFSGSMLVVSERIVAMLASQQSVAGENALGLFLKVLQDRTDKQDLCHNRLAVLADLF